MKDKRLRLLVISRFFLPSNKSSVRRIVGICNTFSSNKPLHFTLLTSGVSADIDMQLNIIRVEPFGGKKPTEAMFNTNNQSKLPPFEKDMLFWLPKAFFSIFFKRYDVVYCSAPPFTIMLLGFLLKLTRPFRPFKLVVEYRDLIGFNPQAIETFSKRFYRNLEVFILKLANTVIVTTNGMKSTLAKRIKADRILVVRNYMSKNEHAEAQAIRPFAFDKEHYHVGYVGILSTGRSPETLFSLVKYTFNNKPIKLHVVGLNAKSQSYLIEKYRNLPNFNNIIFHPRVSRAESLKYIMSFDANTFIINPNAKISEGYGIPGKIYDYMLISRTVVADDASCDNLGTDIEFEVNDLVPGFKELVFPQPPYLDTVLESAKLTDTGQA